MNSRMFPLLISLLAILQLQCTPAGSPFSRPVELNTEIFEKRAILSTVEDYLPDSTKVGQLTDEQVTGIFQTQIEQVVCNTAGERQAGLRAEEIELPKERKKKESERLLPLYIYQSNGQKLYILSFYGSGLWDAIWGYVALRDDRNTVAGAAFDHAGETPGLGAEIKDNPAFTAQFKGKQIYRDGTLVGLSVTKDSTGTDDPYHVDGISGATVTNDGVTEMLREGFRQVEACLEKLQ